MIQRIAVGSTLTVVTSEIHAGCRLAAPWAFRLSHADRRVSTSRRAGVMLTAALVLMMFLLQLQSRRFVSILLPSSRAQYTTLG